MRNLVEVVCAFGALYRLYCVYSLSYLPKPVRYYLLFISPVVTNALNSRSFQDVVVSVIAYYLIIALVLLVMLCVWIFLKLLRQNKEDEHG